jgi:hypothetical protein
VSRASMKIIAWSFRHQTPTFNSRRARSSTAGAERGLWNDGVRCITNWRTAELSRSLSVNGGGHVPTEWFASRETRDNRKRQALDLCLARQNSGIGETPICRLPSGYLVEAGVLKLGAALSQLLEWPCGIEVLTGSQGWLRCT